MKKIKWNNKKRILGIFFISFISLSVLISNGIFQKNEVPSVNFVNYDSSITNGHGYTYKYGKKENTIVWDDFKTVNDSIVPIGWTDGDDIYTEHGNIEYDYNYEDSSEYTDRYRFNQLNPKLLAENKNGGDNGNLEGQARQLSLDYTDDTSGYDMNFHEVVSLNFPEEMKIKEIEEISLSFSIEDRTYNIGPMGGDRQSEYYYSKNEDDPINNGSKDTNIQVNIKGQSENYTKFSIKDKKGSEITINDSNDEPTPLTDVKYNSRFTISKPEASLYTDYYSIDRRDWNDNIFADVNFLLSIIYDENGAPSKMTLWSQDLQEALTHTEGSGYKLDGNSEYDNDDIYEYKISATYYTDEKDLNSINEGKYNIEQTEQEFLKGIQDDYESSIILENSTNKSFTNYLNNLTYGDINDIILNVNGEDGYSIISYNEFYDEDRKSSKVQKLISSEIEIQFSFINKKGEEEWYFIDDEFNGSTFRNQIIQDSTIKFKVISKENNENYGYQNGTIPFKLIIPGFGINIEKLENPNLIDTSDYKIAVDDETSGLFSKNINLDIYTNSNLDFTINDDNIQNIEFDGETIESNGYDWEFNTNFKSGFQIDQQQTTLEITYGGTFEEENENGEITNVQKELYTIYVNIHFMEGTPIHSDGNSNGFEVKTGINASNSSYNINQVMEYNIDGKKELANVFITNKKYMEISISDYEKELIESVSFSNFGSEDFRNGWKNNTGTENFPFENKNNFEINLTSESSETIINRVIFTDIYGTSYTYYFIVIGDLNEYNFTFEGNLGTINPLVKEGEVGDAHLKNYWMTEEGKSTLETLEKKGIYKYEQIYSLQAKEIEMFEELPGLFDLKNLIININNFSSITSSFEENKHITFGQIEPLISEEINNQIWDQTYGLYTYKQDLNNDGDVSDILTINENEVNLDINQDGDKNDIIENVNESNIYSIGLQENIDYTIYFPNLTSSTIITNSTLIKVGINSTLPGYAYNNFSFEFYPSLKEPTPFWVIFLITFLIIILIVSIALIGYGLYKRKQISGKIKV